MTPILHRSRTLSGAILGVVAGMTALGCTSETPAGPVVTATDGQELFSMKALGSEAGCVTCHSLTPDHVIVGPSLAGLADRADQRIPGVAAEAYVRSSILDPNRYVLPGFEKDQMPTTFGELLTDEQLGALVNYVLGVPG